ncbi:MAG: rod shape-determining protein RodA [Firmicutes bacterium]|nr:rod shape-determining protein RodA [Bacillota bacterium]MCM1401169.1 rod shape-determining protein RodA [Bacteroides sp.]MCM1477711.1 rod shape-determining protein RodA [Bacteroides sp.]
MQTRENSTSIFSHVDWVTIILYLVLITAGIFSIYAASYDFDNASLVDPEEFSGKQIRWIGLSLALALVILLFDSHVFETYAIPIYLTILFIMLVTIFIAPNINGSHSWLVLGPIRFQPAEFGKFATALALAKLFNSYNFKLNASLKNYGLALAIIFLPILLILAQNETGTALAYTALFFVLYREGMSGLILLAALSAVTFFVVAVKYTDSLLLGIPLGEAVVFVLIMILMVALIMFYAKQFIIARNVMIWYAATGLLVATLSLFGVQVPGLAFFLPVILLACGYCGLAFLRLRNPKLLATIIATIVSILFLFSVNYAFNHLLLPHQQQRINVALGISDDPLGSGYNVNQSKIAIGSGGFAGKGFLNGTQTKLKYVPEQHTDFIYCTIGEEEGFIGSSAVLLLFLALILRIMHIAERQPTAFGRVYGYCVASYLIFHLAINTGMVIGLCPVIGIPLPFFSYGGSSLWSFTILIFILLRLDAARKEHHSFR